MDFNFTDEQKLIRQTVRDFAEREVKPLAQELDEKGEFSVELTKKMGELGLFGMYLPEKYGGQGLDTLSYIIAVEELARIDSSQAATLAAHNSLGIGPLYYFGNEEQKMKYLPKLCTGENLWAFGLTEPDAGSDSRGTKTTAKLVDGKWNINGSKIFITNGASELATGACVQTVTEKKDDISEFTTIIVDKGTPGFNQIPMHGKMMWRASDTAELYFDNCEVPEENILGKKGQGSKIMLSTLDNGRLSIAAMGLGLARGALEMAVQYSKERKQFGKPISKFQAISFRLADMATKIELAGTLLYKACWLKDAGKSFAKEAAMSKLY
ncbi:MAG: acyl-CoA dehydrogenase, partial [Bacteroidetes bacterium]